MQSWYRYRFIADPRAAEAMAVMKLAGGCSFLGYYMYHGGSNPVGKRGFLNEHVVPRISYDFQAPLGEFGQVRESYRRLRRIHLFCRHFAGELAPTEPVLPPGAEDIDPRDSGTLRWAARVRDASGFVFLNSFQDHAAMEDHRGLALRVRTSDGPVLFPSSGSFTLRAGDCAIMPFGMDLAGVRLVSSTAQPLGRLEVDGAHHFFFYAHDGIEPEYCVRAGSSTTVHRPSLPSLAPLSFGREAGPRVFIHTLTPAQSLGFSLPVLWGRPRALITDAEAFEDGGALRIQAAAGNLSKAWVFPGPDLAVSARGGTVESSNDGPFGRLLITVPPLPVEIEVERFGDADALVRLGDEAFKGMAEFLLSVEYEGDVGSAFIVGRLVADNFSNGAPWEIGLSGVRGSGLRAGLSLHVTPRIEGSVVIRESGMAVQQELRGKKIAKIRGITATAIGEVVIGPTGAAAGSTAAR